MLFAELEPFLDKKRKELLEALSAFGKNEREYTEYEGGWNISEIVEHLCIVEEQVIHTIGQMLRDAPSKPTESEEDKIVDITEIFRRNGLLGSRKQSPPEAVPAGTWGYDAGLYRLAEVRSRLKAYLPELAGRATNGITARHPLGVELNVCQWVLFSAFHEWAHLHQIKRIRQAHDPAL
ncbi:DinB family protein [Paenibacillus sp. FJAT-26967]|uniref:DinB family protein n=1 Tax=Paenibacillus sp. FJAT-26967 TaxID=1729690 RepID=UPI000839525E|nr:DinB family protein [Paenibacillus sp. FJAT-26967]